MSTLSIEQQAYETYQKNMEYFERKHPQVYRKLFLLDIAIGEGKYQEKYSLEYKDDYFDVLEKATNNYLYNCDSVHFGKEAANSVNFKKSDHVIESFYNYEFTEESAKSVEQLPATASSLATIAPVIHYVNQSVSKSNRIKKIYKFMILGVGLGTHIPEIDKKLRANIYLIVEDDLELFRLSLFVTDYAALGDDCELYFSIMDNRTDFISRFNDFFHSAFIRNHYLKFYAFSSEYATKIKEIQNAVVTQSHLTYTHNRLLKKSLDVLQSLKDEYRFLNISKHFPENQLQKKPILFVAAGPSLEGNIEWLSENQDHFIIFSVFMALPILQKYGIIPDIVLHIDEGAEPIRKTLEKISFDDMQKTQFIFAPSIPLHMFTPYIDKSRIYLVEDRTHFKHNFGNITAMSVGEAGYSLSLIFGMKTIYLLGLDLALGEDGQTHSRGHVGSSNKRVSEQKRVEEVVTLRDSILKIRGNFREYVYTTPLFDGSIHLVNQHTENLKRDDQSVYNLCDGARFENITPCRVEQVDIQSYKPIDKEKLRDDLEALLQNRSTTSLSESEKELFEIRFEDAKEKLQAIEEFGKEKCVSMDRFQQAFNLLSAKLIMVPTNETGELAQIYNIYLHYIGGYITNITNSEGVSNPKRHIKKLQKILVRQLEKFAVVYIEAIEALQESPETELLEA